MQSFAGDIPMLDPGMAEFQAAMRIIDVLFRIPTPQPGAEAWAAYGPKTEIDGDAAGRGPPSPGRRCHACRTRAQLRCEPKHDFQAWRAHLTRMDASDHKIAIFTDYTARAALSKMPLGAPIRSANPKCDQSHISIRASHTGQSMISNRPADAGLFIYTYLSARIIG
jgi:hypothetical protein